MTGAPPLLVSSFPLKVSQQSLRVANQRKSHNSELSFSIILKPLGIITSFPVEDKNFLRSLLLVDIWANGNNLGGGEAKSVAPLSYYGPESGNTKKRLQRGDKFWRKLYNLNLFVTNRFYYA